MCLGLFNIYLYTITKPSKLFSRVYESLLCMYIGFLVCLGLFTMYLYMIAKPSKLFSRVYESLLCIYIRLHYTHPYCPSIGYSNSCVCEYVLCIYIMLHLYTSMYLRRIYYVSMVCLWDLICVDVASRVWLSVVVVACAWQCIALARVEVRSLVSCRAVYWSRRRSACSRLDRIDRVRCG